MDFNIPSPLRVPILREDLLTLIASNLVKPVWYKITDAIDGTIPIYVVGETINTLRGTAIKEDVAGTSYLYGTYTIGTTGNMDDVFTAQGGGSGAFIPLAGTNPGSPVTGDIEIQNSGTSTTEIQPTADGVIISTVDANTNHLATYAGGAYMSEILTAGNPVV